METLRLTNQLSGIAEAGSILSRGGLVAFPTETVYGLGANALDRDAVARIFKAKGRPADNPLIVHICDRKQLNALVCAIPEQAEALMDAFWPGPLTLVMKKTKKIPPQVSGGLDTVAVRMPAHKTALAVIRAAGVPIAAPSANRSGSPSPTSAQHVLADLDGRIDAVIDGGSCSVGVESTVLALTGATPRLLRPGRVTAEELEAVIGPVEIDPAVWNDLEPNARPASPGMKYKHYAPKAELILLKGSFAAFQSYTARHAPPGTYALCFTGEEQGLTIPAVPYGAQEDAAEQARTLFGALRKLDEAGAQVVYARCPDTGGVGMAVYNRLIRAAAHRVVVLEETVPPRFSGGFVLGITGPTGAGKTYVCNLLADMGFYHCDTDRISRQVTQRGSPILADLAQTFGADILQSDGSLDRRLLARRAFQDPLEEQKLNAIVHPEVLRRVEKIIVERIQAGDTKIVLDVPLLFESGADRLCDRTLAVLCDKMKRLHRIMVRDNLSKDQALLRMNIQPGDDFYQERADAVIHNNGRHQIEARIQDILEEWL